MKSSNVTVDLFGVKIDFVDTNYVLDAIQGWRREPEVRYVCFANPYTVVTCARDPELTAAVAEAELVLPDGIGMILAARVLGYHHSGRVTGPSFMDSLCAYGCERRYRHFLLGGAPGVAERLAARLTTRYPGLRVAGAFSPPYRTLTKDEEREMICQINEAEPDVVWVGLGFPKQEKWMARLSTLLAPTVMLGVGAAFDFHAGTVPWAPPWVRKAGLEWAFRMAHEPSIVSQK